MPILSPDTTPEIEAILLARMRNASGLEKWRMVAELNASVRLLALAGLRQHPPAHYPPPQKIPPNLHESLLNLHRIITNLH